MSISIDQSFIRQFEAEVHEAYQRMGSKLRQTVRAKANVRGSSTTFQKVGQGAASTKSRHGLVPVMTIDHSAIECVLTDYYAGDWIDKLDEMKVNIDERHVIANAGAYALGRKTDELIIAGLDASTNYAGLNTDGLTKDKILTAFEMMGTADVPDDGQRFAVIGWKQWAELLDIPEFANAEYVGPEALPWRDTQAKRWLGTTWIPHSGLSLAGSARLCHWYHRSAIGHASGQEVQTDITWHGDRAAYFVANMMSQGAVMVEDAGVVTMRCFEA